MSRVHDAAFGGDLDSLRELLAANPGAASETDPAGRTPLHCAAAAGRDRAVELLLDTNAQVDARDGTGATPLHLAAERNSVSVMCALLEAGADADARTKEGRTPLHRAAESWGEKGAEILLGHGADANAADCRGETPLHTAAALGHRYVAEKMIAARANVNALSEGRRTPLKYSTARDQEEVSSLLRRHKGTEGPSDKFARYLGGAASILVCAFCVSFVLWYFVLVLLSLRQGGWQTVVTPNMSAILTVFAVSMAGLFLWTAATEETYGRDVYGRDPEKEGARAAAWLSVLFGIASWMLGFAFAVLILNWTLGEEPYRLFVAPRRIDPIYPFLASLVLAVLGYRTAQGSSSAASRAGAVISEAYLAVALIPMALLAITGILLTITS